MRLVLGSGRRSRPPRPLLTIALLVGGAVLIIGGAGVLWIALSPVPDIASFAAREVDQSTKIYDRTGQILLYDYNRDARRQVVSLPAISQNVQNAVIATEDASFYQHGGIRITSIIRAVLADLVPGGGTQGGSTITQQVIKNSILTNERSVARKIHEWVLAIKMEEVYSKDQILEAYLNDIPFGGTLYGVEAASETYFGKTAHDLSLAESAYLAAMIQAPSYYSPYGKNRNALDARKGYVLARMHDLGLIPDAEYATAKAESVSFAPQNPSSIIAPHFVFYILDYLKEKYGPQALIEGLRVTTTLDADLETKAEAIIADYAEKNQKNFNASNAAMVALDPSTGQILAMVGSRDFFSTEIDGQYNAALALRQPGSTFKPFVYSLALKDGYTRDTVVYDVPTQFSTLCPVTDIYNDESPCYAPEDFDGKYRGPMTFETALAQSINIPAVKVLYLVGVANAVRLAESFGISTLGDPARYGLTLVLGGGEVTLLDITDAYAVFADDGVRNPATGVLEITDSTGATIEKYAGNPATVIPANIARDISAMLSDNQARVPEYPLDSPLHFGGYDVAVKTGTTNDTRDVWVIGYTPSIAIGTWAGNNDNSKMVKNIAGFILAPMWHDIMAYALSKYPKTYFGEPTPIPSTLHPMLAGSWQIPDASGQVVPHDLLYYFDKQSPQGPPPANPASDPQYARWEYGVQAWFTAHPAALSAPQSPPPVPLSSPAVVTEDATGGGY